MSTNREKPLTNIKTWLIENNRRITEVEDDEYAFHLEVMPKSDRALPFDILASKKVESILVTVALDLYFKGVSNFGSKIQNARRTLPRR